MLKEFRFAVIGCGGISKLHIKQIQSIPNAKLIAVADEVEERAKEFGELYDVDWYVGYKEMLKRDDIDIVNIVTPSGLHGKIAIDVAKSGMHVIVEKPIEVTLEKANEMIQVCKESNVKLTVISQHRFDAATRKIHNDIIEGKFGELVMGQACIHWYRSQAYYDSGAWRGTWELDGGGVLMNQSIHTIDLLQLFMGPVESVFAHTATKAHKRIEVEDIAVATVKFKSGALGTITATTAAFPGLSTRIDIFGTKGTAIIQDDKLTQCYFSEENNIEFLDLEKTKNIAETIHLENHHQNAHRLQFLDMMDAITNDREPEVNGPEGIKPLEIILAIYKSAQTGKEISLPIT
ncbi:Gfo/Idh/MocA family protein [Neobacillus ginsengisoli]|uniref:Dehydrogenase n=1 Tax=Neobacillus ginsengisoli TaxID=904295 RepID=A0ABT9Y121_9BACI|nr:Gfo/Idh/MocA family oxidoreductase [Neobacillus ginsengisoli]MDQ0201446.1 putative dehydrogenase [Neobacillus ginsengisoli]